MKVNYDVKIPPKYPGRYAKEFKEFYESEHANAKWEFEDIDAAKKCHSAICMFASRNKIHDLVVTRRENVLYLIRSEATC